MLRFHRLIALGIGLGRKGPYFSAGIPSSAKADQNSSSTPGEQPTPASVVAIIVVLVLFAISAALLVWALFSTG